jgi:hypothetical protein
VKGDVAIETPVAVIETPVSITAVVSETPVVVMEDKAPVDKFHA